MRSFVLFTFLLSSFVSASEPSVFGAGDLNSPSPYGLTHEEKLILENKKEIQTVLRKSNAQNAKVQTVTERLDGMQGIIEGLSQRSGEHSTMLQKLEEKHAAQGGIATEIESLKKSLSANTENIAQFKTLLGELSAIVDEINGNYVTKEQFAELIKRLKVAIPDNTVSSAKMSNAALEKEGNALFAQKRYAEAQKYFEQMVQKNHKTAEAYFMIGESLFERNAHKEAIGYYKQSASKNEKAFYMPTLLLHTGIAMEKTGDKGSAKAFYQATISKYGGTGAAKEAQEKLSNLK
jgi:TolA-binding protein